MNWKLMALLAGIIMGFGSAAHAQTSSSAVAQVRVQILPKVSVSAVTQVVDLGSFRTGTMGANLVYHVEANGSQVAVFVEVSDLYRVQNPPAARVESIPLNTSAGIEVRQGNGASWHSANNRLSITSTGSEINGLPAQKTEVGHLASSRNIFNGDVIVHVTWDQKDPDRTPGEYGAFIRLTTTVLPN
jgi:hypothetical protein